MLRIFAMRLLAVVFGCVLIGPARGAVSSPGNAHRIPTPNAFIRQIDATITYSYDANGNRVSEAGQTTPTATSGTLVGSGTNFLGAGGTDTFLRSPFGHLGVFETSQTGAIVASQWLSNGSGEIAIDGATTIVGTGRNFGGTGGNDIFVRTANDQLNIWEFNQAGLITYSEAVTINGAASTIDAATLAIGTAQNFLGLGGNDVILRDGAGHIGIWEVNSGAAILAAPDVTLNGSLATTGVGTVLLGTGQNFLGLGGNDMFFQWSNGHLGVWELASGAVILATPNVTSNGSEVAAGNGTQLLGTGQNFLGLGGNDMFFRWSNGHLGIYEMNSAAQVQSTPDLTINGSEFGTSNGTQLLGTGQNFLGLGGNDMFFRWSNGHLGIYEMNSAAQVQSTPDLTINGSEVATGNGTGLLGTGQNFFAQGGNDLFFRSAAGAMSIWEIDGNGVILADPSLSFSGGPLVVAARSRVTATGLDPGNGLHDFVLNNSNGSVVIYDLGPNSTLQVSSN